MYELFKTAEAATGGVLQKKAFLKTSQYSQENTSVGALKDKKSEHNQWVLYNWVRLSINF